MPESNRTAERWAVKDKKRLLVAMIVGDARMSIEGDLRGFRLMPIAVPPIKRPILKRNTQRPRQDFIVVPLEPETIPAVLPVICGSVPHKILHIQREKMISSIPSALFSGALSAAID
jgi:hypothetical protein